jgi:beta-glucosidase
MDRIVAVAFMICLLSGLMFAGIAQESPSNRQSDELVESILRQMTIEEKFDLLGITNGAVPGVPRLGVPPFRTSDGPLGVRSDGPATAMAAGISLAATWDPGFAEKVGVEIGRDARARGFHLLFGPGVNIYRSPLNGRNFEYYGEDPFLASRIAVGYVRGVQSQGVSATIKHFTGNNSEFDRHNTDSRIDERTAREIYLPVFEAAVREAHVGAIMDSYNLVNGEHASQNSHILTDILRHDWGFDGVVVSDFQATYDGVAAFNAGQDLELPALRMTSGVLLPAMQQKKITTMALDEHVRRILRLAVRFGWLKSNAANTSIPHLNQTGRQVALQAARESIVLLKNDRDLLPLNRSRLKSVLVVGPNAYPAVPAGGGSAHVQPFSAVSFMEGLSQAFGTNADVLYHGGIPTLRDIAAETNFTKDEGTAEQGLRAEFYANENLDGAPSVVRTDLHVNYGPQPLPDGTLSSRWSGYYTPRRASAHEVFVQSTGEFGGYYRLYIDDRLILDNWTSATALTGYETLMLEAKPHRIVFEQHGRLFAIAGGVPSLRLGVMSHESLIPADAVAMAEKADAVVVAVGFGPDTEGEGADRTFALPPAQEQLIHAMSKANKNVIVVLTSGGAVDMTQWIDEVPALLQAWYPGQEGGTALAEILSGNADPGGRLPGTFERSWADNPVHDTYYPILNTNRIEYREGVFVGYRGYEHNGTKPLFPFGFGLSYTRFRYANLRIQSANSAYTVSFDVKNTGSREGTDVAQIYVSDKHAQVPRPPKELKGFSKIKLRPGETRRVTVLLNDRAFSYYDVDSHSWRTTHGEYDILVSRSAAEVELSGHVTLP